MTVIATASALSQGLSTGAQAGIGVAAACVLILLVILGAYLCMHRHKRQKSATETTHVDRDVPGLYMKPELEAPTTSNQVSQAGVAELDAPMGAARRAELEAS